MPMIGEKVDWIKDPTIRFEDSLEQEQEVDYEKKLSMNQKFPTLKKNTILKFQV